MKRLSRYFLEGMLFLVPVVATMYVISVVFTKIDHLFNFTVPGLGVAVTILSITAVGFVASNFLVNRVVRFTDMVFTRLPLVKMFYRSIKDLVNAFVGDKKSFNRPVLVTLAKGSHLQTLGFMTQENLVNLKIYDRVAVYVPQSYNFAGHLLIVPSDQIERLDADPGKVMAFIVSGGVSAPQTP